MKLPRNKKEMTLFIAIISIISVNIIAQPIARLAMYKLHQITDKEIVE